MDNDTRDVSGDQDGNNHPPPSPSQSRMEKFMTMQMQMMHTVTTTMQTLRNAREQPPLVQASPPRDKCSEFLDGNPPMFSHTSDPIEAGDWLRAVERELEIAQCTDREKVLYGSRQLRGAAQDWWDSYLYSHGNKDTITWSEFKHNFREDHVPASLMKMKKEEFLAFKQETMSVAEYRDKFIQLSRYAPTKIDDDAKKQECFMNGLDDDLQYQLMNHVFPNFQHLVDQAIHTEVKRQEIQEMKRKF